MQSSKKSTMWYLTDLTDFQGPGYPVSTVSEENVGVGAKSKDWVFTPTGRGAFTIQSKEDMDYLDAYTVSASDYQVVLRKAQGDSSQEWVLTNAEGGGCTFQQKSNMRYLDAYAECGQEACKTVTREAQGDASQVWVFTPPIGAATAAMETPDPSQKYAPDYAVQTAAAATLMALVVLMTWKVAKWHSARESVAQTLLLG